MQNILIEKLVCLMKNEEIEVNYYERIILEIIGVQGEEFNQNRHFFIAVPYLQDNFFDIFNVPGIDINVLNTVNHDEEDFPIITIYFSEENKNFNVCYLPRLDVIYSVAECHIKQILKDILDINVQLLCTSDTW